MEDTMKKTLILLVLVLVTATAVFAEYDSDTVVAVMRGNLSHVNTATEATDSGDFFTAATEFMAIAEGMNSIKHFEPYRGAKADWDANIAAVMATAFKAIGACGMEDGDKVHEYINELWALNKQGHGDNK
jgi:hypothetical protein